MVTITGTAIPVVKHAQGGEISQGVFTLLASETKTFFIRKTLGAMSVNVLGFTATGTLPVNNTITWATRKDGSQDQTVISTVSNVNFPTVITNIQGSGMFITMTNPDASANTITITILTDYRNSAGALQIKGFNTTTGTFDVSVNNFPDNTTLKITNTQLTAPGSTPAVDVSLYKKHSYQILVAAINSSVTYIVQVSEDATNWSDHGEEETVYANGTYNVGPIDSKYKYMRFTFLSEAGGTAVTLDVVEFHGN